MSGKKNTRDFWIDDLQSKSTTILEYLNKKDQLNRKEQELAELCAGFIYLHNICEDRQFLDEPDNELFEEVTIH
tara:strand:+ start:263 stop:484 length:222 start_codon:yes stop_codon:yes gene_type:complete